MIWDGKGCWRCPHLWMVDFEFWCSCKGHQRRVFEKDLDKRPEWCPL